MHLPNKYTYPCSNTTVFMIKNIDSGAMFREHGGENAKEMFSQSNILLGIYAVS